MKKLYDIRINPEPISSEEIEKHMDFDALLTQFEAEEAQPKVVQLRRRTPIKRWALLAASFVGFVFVTYAIQQAFFSENSRAEQVALPFINPPIKTVQKTFANFEVDVQNGGEFTMEDGTKILIPKDAFTDNKGALIMGTIVLKYRKYQDIADIFLSGIPMQYDSANVRYDMASVGMMELYGYHNGKMVNIQQNTPLSVQLVTQTDLNQIKDYNVYQLDTLAKNWEFVALDDISIKMDKATNKRIDAALAESEIVKKLAVAHNQLKALEKAEQRSENSVNEEFPTLPKKPTKPHTPNSDNLIFDFDLSAFAAGDGIDDEFEPGGEYYDSTMYNANQHLEQYASVMWEVSKDQKAKYDVAVSVEWRHVQLDKIDDQRFKLSLSNGKNKVQLIVNPILSRRELDKANTIYRKQMADYEAALAAYQAIKKPKVKATEKVDNPEIIALENEIAALQQSYNKARIKVMRSMDLELKDQTIVNRFKVKGFGIWNCDKPEPAEKKMVKADFQDKNGNKIDYYMVYVADKNNGRVQRFYTNQSVKIAYNPNSENVLWMVSKTGEIAIAKASEFKKIGHKKEFTFTLDKTTQQIKNKEDVKRLLGL